MTHTRAMTRTTCVCQRRLSNVTGKQCLCTDFLNKYMLFKFYSKIDKLGLGV